MRVFLFRNFDSWASFWPSSSLCSLWLWVFFPWEGFSSVHWAAVLCNFSAHSFLFFLKYVMWWNNLRGKNWKGKICLWKALDSKRQCLSKHWVVWGVPIVTLTLDSRFRWACKFNLTSLLASFGYRDGVPSAILYDLVCFTMCVHFSWSNRWSIYD